MNPKIQIEKNVPYPSSLKYPFDEMDVGDSFFLLDKRRSRVAAAASDWGKKNGKKFSVRQMDEGLRCWRIS